MTAHFTRQSVICWPQQPGSAEKLWVPEKINKEDDLKRNGVYLFRSRHEGCSTKKK